MIIKAVSDIVPENFSINSIFSLIKNFKDNSGEAKNQLNKFVRQYFL